MIFPKEVILFIMIGFLMLWDIRTRASGKTGVAIYLLMAFQAFLAITLILSLFE